VGREELKEQALNVADETRTQLKPVDGALGLLNEMELQNGPVMLLLLLPSTWLNSVSCLYCNRTFMVVCFVFFIVLRKQKKPLLC
jgi:hypothetical protein